MPNFELQTDGQLYTLDQWVMGIVNATPDSFHADSRTASPEAAAAQAEQMLREGARVIDVGGYSSRPGAAAVSPEEEWDRLKETLPAIRAVVDTHNASSEHTAFISVDTFRARVADQALSNGAHWINDISAGQLDPEIHDVAAQHRAPYIAMHMQGTPQTMQDAPNYRHVTQDLLKYFSELLPSLHEKGVHDTILDVGIGFGKTLEQNYQLLRELGAFQFLGRPLLTGVSRKSLIYKVLQSTPDQALNGTTALHMAALLGGTNLLRVHDVAPAVECIALFRHLMPDGAPTYLEPWER